MRKLSICLGLLLFSGCGDEPVRPGVTNRSGSPTEEEAAANRARLRTRPIQTEGIGPDQSWKSIPVETPTEQAQPTIVKIQINMQISSSMTVGDQVVKCPHCGQQIKVEVTPHFVNDNAPAK